MNNLPGNGFWPGGAFPFGTGAGPRTRAGA